MKKPAKVPIYTVEFTGKNKQPPKTFTDVNELNKFVYVKTPKSPFVVKDPEEVVIVTKIFQG